MDDELRSELENIKKSLAEIKEKISSIERLELSEIDYINIIKSMESKELENLGTLEQLENKELTHLVDVFPKKFPTVTTWKTNLWENCEARELTETTKIVLYKCKLTNKICSFESCPKNKLNN